MFEILSDPAIWASFLTLTVLEIVLGVDNVVFISITASRLPESQGTETSRRSNPEGFFRGVKPAFRRRQQCESRNRALR